jgi:sorbitol/mannitol transport system permease protein
VTAGAGGPPAGAARGTTPPATDSPERNGMSVTLERADRPAEGAAPPRGGGALRRSADWARRAPLLPALVFTIIVTQLPFVATLVISFMNWNAYYPNERGFGGLTNYQRVLTDVTTRDAIIVTIELTVVVVLVSLVLGLLIALLLDRKFFGRGAVRTMMITPFLVVPVAAALIWKHAIFNPVYGLLNGVLTWIWQLFGSNNPPQPDWISTFPLGAIEVALIWQWTPFMMLILLAGLQSRPLDVIEAARIDGASGWQIFRYMTFPHLRQYMELGALLGAIYIVQTFDAVFVITSGGLGTANLPYVIYQTFYLAHDYGRASAAGVITLIGTIIIATLALRTVSTLFRQEVAR